MVYRDTQSRVGQLWADLNGVIRWLFYVITAAR